MGWIKVFACRINVWSPHLCHSEYIFIISGKQACRAVHHSRHTGSTGSVRQVAYLFHRALWLCFWQLCPSKMAVNRSMGPESTSYAVIYNVFVRHVSCTGKLKPHLSNNHPVVWIVKMMAIPFPSTYVPSKRRPWPLTGWCTALKACFTWINSPTIVLFHKWAQTRFNLVCGISLFLWK
jgi:hypothetical protein